MRIGSQIFIGLFLLGAVWLFPVHRSSAQTNIISFTNRAGTVYENVRVVRIQDDKLVYVSTEGLGGGSIKLIDLPDGLLQRFGYDSSKLADRELEKAVASGMFRKINGVIYDMRKGQPEWTLFQNAQLFQKLDDDSALVNIAPDFSRKIEVIHVKHLAGVSDTERFSFRARVIGTYSYINKLDDDRVIRSYDVGRTCSRQEIPDRMIKEGLATIQISQEPSAMVASLGEILPGADTDKLIATGSGFFITDDGYLVTNDHVVRNANKLKIRVGATTLDVKLIKTSKMFDLAVLKVEGRFKALPVDFDRGMHLGDSVFTIGFPNVDIQGAAPKYTDGKISSLSGMEDDPSQYQISVPVQPGNSGGPLVSENGAVVGIVRAKLNDLTALEISGSVPQNVNYAVKSKYLKDLLETVPGVVDKMKSTNKTGNSSGVKAAEDAAVIVLVY